MALMVWIVLGLVLAIAARQLGRASSLVRYGIVYFSHAALIYYLVWRISATLPPLSWSVVSGVACALLVFESLAAYVMVAGIEFPTGPEMWPTLRPFITQTIDRRAEADRQLDWYGSAPPLVCILIPTFNEPWGVIEKALVGASSQSYPNHEVWVLDDGRRDWLREKVEARGMRYLARASNEHYKAGNLNHALAQLRARPEPVPFVAILDADFVAWPELVRRTVALMASSDVGIVQTPQCFYNPDPFQRAFGVRNWPEEQRWWFDIEEPALDKAGTAVCCGTACLVRVAALESIGGGFPTASVTEDSLCSAMLGARGWRTLFLTERLAVGLAAEGVSEWFTQRVRWLQGDMQNRAQAGRPRGLYNRVNYWLSFLSLSIYAARDLTWALALVVFWFSGAWVIDAAVPVALAHVLPLWVAPLFWSWLSRGRRNPLVTSAQFKLQRFVWLAVPLLAALSSRVPRFEVTSKARARHQVTIHWRLLRWHALLLAALSLGVTYALVGGDAGSRQHPWFWVNLLASLYLIAETLAAIAPAIELPHRRSDDRYSTRERVRVSVAAEQFDTSARNVSLSGVLLDEPAGRSLPPEATLILADVGAVRASRVRVMPGAAAYHFESPEQRPALIRKLYCSEGYIPLPDGWRWIDGAAAFSRWLVRLPGLLAMGAQAFPEPQPSGASERQGPLTITARRP